MPLKAGKSHALSNFKKLMTEKPGVARAKAIKTIAQSRGVTLQEAKRIQTAAIMGSLVKKK